MKINLTDAQTNERKRNGKEVKENITRDGSKPSNDLFTDLSRKSVGRPRVFGAKRTPHKTSLAV